MSEYLERLGRALEAMELERIDALCLSVGSDLPYLTGYAAMPLERLTMLVVVPGREPVLVVPELEAPRVDTSGGAFSVRPWTETEDPVLIVDELLGEARRVAIGDQTWTRFSLALQNIGWNRAWVPASEFMACLRVVKSRIEIDALRAAARTVDAVVDAMATVRWSGRTERDVAREIIDRTRAGGHESVGFAIVASGPNGASPHHEPTDRTIEPGDAIVVDFGGHQGGYASDTTRMFVVGDPPDGFDAAYTVLRAAQEAAVEAVKPGVPAESIDIVARTIIADAGYGEHFIHRVGHGIGLDTHEPPYLVEGNEQVLKPSMAFSVEPGIYLPGRWGMRLEDIVVVTDVGVESLNTSDHAYRIVT
jgi:Xaa-Pro aminopeptidase